MKQFIIAMTLFLAFAGNAQAISYEQAREQALFLTDKMAYELNLTDDQYEAAYEINLDYLMGINDRADLYGEYWRMRNMDLSYILLDWQYRAYCAASYFYRPLYWDAGVWHFGIYARYPHRDYFYFGRPNFVFVYRGGHSWHHNGGRSWYHGREYARPHHDGRPRLGMRDRFNRGDYGRGTRVFGGRSNENMVQRNNTNYGGRSHSQYTRSNRSAFGGRDNDQEMRSSTRTTVRRGYNYENRDNRSFGDRNRQYNSSRSSVSTPNRTFSPGNDSRTSSPSRSFGGSSRQSGSFGGSRSGAPAGGGSHSGNSHTGSGHR